MAPTKRYYHVDGPENGLTRSQLKRSSRATKRDYMMAWFHTFFEDPANQTPYNGREGGYQYIHGGPYNPQDELFEEFAGIADEVLIAETAEEIENEDSISDWAPSSAHPDMRAAAEEAMADYEDGPDEYVPGDSVRPSLEERLASIERMLQNGIRPSFGGVEERALRGAAAERVEALRILLEPIQSNDHGMMGHNKPPPATDDLEGQLEKAHEAASTIAQQLAKDEPSPQPVADSASVLLEVAKFVGGVLAAKVIEKVFDKALESVPPIISHIEPAVSAVVQWLESITFPF